MAADLTTSTGVRPPAWPEQVRAAVGVAELLATSRVARWVGADPSDRRVRWTIRVLGARHLGQAVLTTLTPEARSRTGHRLGAAVDVLHGLSMLGLAGVAPSLRRPALSSAALAGTLATAEAVHATRG